MPTVKLIYRKPHAEGSFSIEASFDSMLRAFPPESEFRLEKFVSSFHSAGIRPRLASLREIGKVHADLFHITGDVHFLAYAIPADRTILTIHDCGFMRNKSPVRREILRRLWLAGPVRRCAAITTVSHATRLEVIEHSDCDPGKVQVIPTTINERFEAVETTFDRLKPRVLHIGMTPNKNFLRHVEALSGLRCHLHIVGKLTPEYAAALAKFGIEHSSEFNVSAERMRRIYAETDLLLFASTLEGFGMPIVEAQTTGRAVVTSNTSSMPEVAGAGACLVDPLDTHSIRQGLERVIGDTDYRQSLIRAGYANARRFQPATVARRYADLYRSIAK